MTVAVVPDKDRHQQREWLANLSLGFDYRHQRTTLVSATHCGPLRVQRPFYPEGHDCCHVYLLHPPGGLVLGDKLQITVELNKSSKVLLTTPAAGKVYGTKGRPQQQRQSVVLNVGDDAMLEWLPQETIIFNSAACHLNTRINLSANAKVIGWDIVRLGRAASEDFFNCGSCQQRIEIFRNGRPYFVEKNKFFGSSELLSANWGLQGSNTIATLYATVDLNRDQQDKVIEKLYGLQQKGSWSLTQRGDLLLVRYLGNNIIQCSKGLKIIWQSIHPLFNNKKAIMPRIWNT